MQGNRVIGGNAEISRIIQRGGDTAEDNPDSQESNTPGNARAAENPGQHVLGELDGITHEEQVDERGDSDIMPVQEKIDHEQNGVDDHIQGSEADRNHLVDPVAEALERIHAEEGPFKETDSDTRQGHADDCHDNPAYLFAIHNQPAFR